MGHSYSTVFGSCMDGNVESIAVSDPYIRARHQLHNFVRFCELAIKKCHKLKKISLTTGRDPQSEVSRIIVCMEKDVIAKRLHLSQLSLFLSFWCLSII